MVFRACAAIWSQTLQAQWRGRLFAAGKKLHTYVCIYIYIYVCVCSYLFVHPTRMPNDKFLSTLECHEIHIMAQLKRARPSSTPHSHKGHRSLVSFFLHFSHLSPVLSSRVRGHGSLLPPFVMQQREDPRIGLPLTELHVDSDVWCTNDVYINIYIYIHTIYINITICIYTP